MTVFGRDTLITSLQTLLFGPELARGALAELAALQATEDDASIDAEPGKIVHEVRRGKAATHWFDRYYGTVDATPLYLVLLSEVWRWTDDATLVTELREPALARARAGSTTTATATATASSSTSGEPRAGSRTSRGRTPATRSASTTAASPRRRSRRARCRATSTTRSGGSAELAREVWGDAELADRLEREADELRARFDEAFWVEERGGYYALALDGEKRRVDSLCSNIGHLLWSGIVPPHRVDAVVDALMGDELWSGWGVRTMSAADAAYNPLIYHNGTVWPHDNSL